MVAILRNFEFNVKTVFNSNFNYRWCYFIQGNLILEDLELMLLNKRTNNISIHSRANKISHFSSISSKALVVFIEVRKLEFICFIRSKISNRLQLFRERGEFCWKGGIRVDFYVMRLRYKAFQWGSTSILNASICLCLSTKHLCVHLYHLSQYKQAG